MPPIDRSRARQLAAEDPKGWFERLYQEGLESVPWANLCPNPNLVNWWDQANFQPAGKTALVVGCGVGDDAEQLATWGFEVTAFDLAPTAIAKCKERFPQSAVDYRVADLFQADFGRTFDFVFEAYTVQAMPVEFRQAALQTIERFVAEKGHLLLIARAREDDDPPGQMPWPLSRKDLKAVSLATQSFEDYIEQETEGEGVRRFRVLYQRL